MAAPSLSALVAVGARARDAASNGDAKNGTPIADDDVERYQIQPSTRPAGPAAADAPAPRPTRGGTGCLLMAPPPPRPRPPKKAVLEEEAYAPAALLFPPRYDAPRETALALAQGADIRGGIQRANTRFAPPAPASGRGQRRRRKAVAWPDLSDVASDSDGDSSAYPSAYDGGHDRLVPMTPRIHRAGRRGGVAPR
ncbi:nuclear protein Es2 [Aureococcus anophagefferens]|uniref:Nuclear protein Es2 n=1 Tax=Aureococcus anophagefferens TaxID=44056 RepID=A0ABR1G435_AURAN